MQVVRGMLVAGSPEQRLVAAAILGAARDLRRGSDGRAASGVERQNAERWLLSSSEQPWSFGWCCLTLGCDAAELVTYLRAGGWRGDHAGGSWAW